MKNYKAFKNLNIIIFVYISCLSMGYAFFNESLTINGMAKTVDFYSGKELPNTPVIRDKKNNRYYTYDKSKDKVFFFSENWNQNNYELVIKRVPGLKPGEFTTNYTITMVNPTVLKYTNGNAKSEVVSGSAEEILLIEPTLTKKEILPGEKFDINIKIKYNFPKTYGWVQTKTTVTYTLQNVTRYFYFTIRYQYGW